MTKRAMTGVVLDERVELTLDEFSQACASSHTTIVELVEEGVLEPIEDRREEMVFSGSTLVRARKAMRLKRDLDLNLPGVALALELMDEIEFLRERLRRLERDETD